jgi:hypothetical protein
VRFPILKVSDSYFFFEFYLADKIGLFRYFYPSTSEVGKLAVFLAFFFLTNILSSGVDFYVLVANTQA